MPGSRAAMTMGWSVGERAGDDPEFGRQRMIPRRNHDEPAAFGLVEIDEKAGVRFQIDEGVVLRIFAETVAQHPVRPVVFVEHRVKDGSAVRRPDEVAMGRRGHGFEVAAGLRVPDQEFMVLGSVAVSGKGDEAVVGTVAALRHAEVSRRLGFPVAVDQNLLDVRSLSAPAVHRMLASLHVALVVEVVTIGERDRPVVLLQAGLQLLVQQGAKIGGWLQHRVRVGVLRFEMPANPGREVRGVARRFPPIRVSQPCVRVLVDLAMARGRRLAALGHRGRQGVGIEPL